jgi:hypothetical protein
VLSKDDMAVRHIAVRIAQVFVRRLVQQRSEAQPVMSRYVDRHMDTAIIPPHMGTLIIRRLTMVDIQPVLPQQVRRWA